MSEVNFYKSQAWKSARMERLKVDGFRCVACGASASNGARLHVDHIRPISRFPELKLNEDNLQTLCASCNVGKSNKYVLDLRSRLPEGFIGQLYRISGVLKHFDRIAAKIGLSKEQKDDFKKFLCARKAHLELCQEIVDSEIRFRNVFHECPEFKLWAIRSFRELLKFMNTTILGGEE